MGFLTNDVEIRDDTGQARLVQPEAIALIGRQRRGLERLTREIKEANSRVGPLFALRLVVLGLVVGAVLLSAARGWISPIYGIVAVACFFTVARITSIRRWFSRRTQRSSQRSLAELRYIASAITLHRCPCCAYPLPTPSELVAACPECGALWRADLWRADWVSGVTRSAERRDRRGNHPIIRDARGCEVGLLIHRPPRESRREVGRWAEWTRLLVGLPGLALALLFLVFGFASWAHDVNSSALLLVIGSVVGATLLLFAQAFVVYQAGRGFSEMSTTKGLCPSCETPLPSTPSPIDGALVCTACHAAWKPPA